MATTRVVSPVLHSDQSGGVFDFLLLFLEVCGDLFVFS